MSLKPYQKPDRGDGLFLSAFAKRYFLWGLIFCAFLFALVMGGCSDSFPPEFPAPDFNLKSPNTDWQESLESIKGSPVIMYWFTSW
jgi:hypothetical protein